MSQDTSFVQAIASDSRQTAVVHGSICDVYVAYRLHEAESLLPLHLNLDFVQFWQVFESGYLVEVESIIFWWRP